jgi:hypothetical protein
VDNIEIINNNFNVLVGETIHINANAKDKNGNKLIANINYKYDKRYLELNKKGLVISKKALDKKKFDIDIEAGNIKKKSFNKY